MGFWHLCANNDCILAGAGRKQSVMIEELNSLLYPAGLFYRGGFHPAPGDSAPSLPDGKMAGTVLLIGNAGTSMWQAFEKEADRSVRNPLDTWLREKIDAAAESVGAATIMPNEGPPFVPIQDWAMRAEPVFRSPIGILIHPDYGLWHVYRAALLFKEKLKLPPLADIPSPCAACAKKPCLTVCPADAFLPNSFKAEACADHVDSAKGINCRDRGCLARRACPVGRDHLYEPAQQAFHTAAMVGAVRRGFGGEPQDDKSSD